MMTENENKSCILISANQHQPPPSLPRRITHPNLPKGKEQVTLQLISVNHFSPHLASPEGEGQLLLPLINH